MSGKPSRRVWQHPIFQAGLVCYLLALFTPHPVDLIMGFGAVLAVGYIGFFKVDWDDKSWHL